MKYKLTLTDEDGVVRRTWDLSTIEADWRETEPDYWPAPVRSLLCPQELKILHDPYPLRGNPQPTKPLQLGLGRRPTLDLLEVRDLVRKPIEHLCDRQCSA